MKSNVKEYLVVAISVLTFALTYLVPPIREYFAIENSFGSFLLSVVFFCLGLLVFYIFSTRSTKSESIKRLRNRNSDLKRYSIVIVDDLFVNPRDKTLFKNHLSNYNVCLLPQVDDVRFLLGFDIIVLDIMGATSIFRDTGTILKELYQSYPQKYLMAISQSNSALDMNNRYIDASIQKKNGQKKNEDLIDALSHKFDEVFPILDDPDAYWVQIEKKIRNESPEKKEEIRKTFTHSILGNPSYTLKSK